MKTPSVKPMKSRTSRKAQKPLPLFLGQKVIGELRILMRLASPTKVHSRNGELSTHSSY